MASQKITLSASRDIPFNKLVLSQANVRRVKAGVSIEDLAEDIARRSLLQSLTVRPVLDDEGNETGTFEVPAGGRRFRALELLVKRKRLARTAPVPCVVRTDGVAEEDSLAENVMREPLHPLDQFRAFRTMREQHGMGDEAIAARFFVTPAVVRQRLKLAAASPKLLELYAEDQLTLEQLMAFCVTDDHVRQEQVWESLQRSYSREPHYIRRRLTEGAVRASDKRAVFVGAEAYEAAGGVILRDLFQQDDGGWFQDAALLDRLVAGKLAAIGDEVRAEGWKWVEVAPDFPYGHVHGLRRIHSTQSPLSDEDQAKVAALREEYDRLEAEFAEAEELPEEVDARLGEIEQALARLDGRPAIYDAQDVARAGAFVSLEHTGAARIERGFVRPEDEAPAPEPAASGGDGKTPGPDGSVQRTVITIGGQNPAQPDGANQDDEDDARPLSQQLRTELSAHRTLALRGALADDPDAAFLAVLHALCLQAFYGGAAAFDSCLEIEAKSLALGHHASGLNDTPAAKLLEERHAAWAAQLPREAADLWDTLLGFDTDSRASLFAWCAARTVNAVHQTWDRKPRALAHADRLAEAVRLDMAAGWTATVDSYLGRVTKAHILRAVREAKGGAAAQLIGHLKKGDMAAEAERLLAGTGWLPEPLRTAGAAPADDARGSQDDADAVEALPAFLVDDEHADAEPDRAIAAE